ncbi:hypothetical protein [Glutamicibacter sp.]|uniref:hypothetical protein n=1 Tax=Glutamicibacter sp. TaxID=1931995 RepID=UPI002B46D314|nr:hypothetical protein [Glutamicibacter sp.]HJX78374.1 hypothetical protein [Glutamicibacter sp.]
MIDRPRESRQLPIAVRATALQGTRRLSRRSFRYFRYALRYADGRELHEVGAIEFDTLLQGHRYPADTKCVRDGARQHCPHTGDGPWVDYPYGMPLAEPRES